MKLTKRADSNREVTVTLEPDKKADARKEVKTVKPGQ
jgi:hypothetical protein